MPPEKALGLIAERLTLVFTNTLSMAAVGWIVATLSLYAGALVMHKKVNAHPVLHPMLLTLGGVLSLLTLTDTPIKLYQQHTAVIHWLLGPATVALALPMYAQWHKVQQLGWRLVVAVLVAGVVAPVLAWGCLWITNAPLAVQLTMLAKSITTPLAMETSRIIGGIPALAAVFVIVTGIVGAIAGPATFRLLHITNPQAQGIALGAVTHAIGTARAIKMGEAQAAMSSLGLCLNGIMTALILPLVIP